MHVHAWRGLRISVRSVYAETETTFLISTQTLHSFATPEVATYLPMLKG